MKNGTGKCNKLLTSFTTAEKKTKIYEDASKKQKGATSKCFPVGRRNSRRSIWTTSSSKQRQSIFKKVKKKKGGKDDKILEHDQTYHVRVGRSFLLSTPGVKCRKKKRKKIFCFSSSSSPTLIHQT